ncbi:hypothetical protein Syun_008327 [Stephania yunnanensis]|uniref:Uncharacterized protein n=1 Tax=Stephania yunnanensis TaxID=152371 RepID=A0AAP0KE39_9MAGN
MHSNGSMAAAMKPSNEVSKAPDAPPITGLPGELSWALVAPCLISAFVLQLVHNYKLMTCWITV